MLRKQDDITPDVFKRPNWCVEIRINGVRDVTHTVDPNLNAPLGAFEDIWRNIVLFAEHTWLSYNSISQPDHEQSIRQARVKDDRAARAALGIEDVMNR